MFIVMQKSRTQFWNTKVVFYFLEFADSFFHFVLYQTEMSLMSNNIGM